jgi:hypothetical protein
MSEANTISIKIYTPGGGSGYFCIPVFQDNSVMSAAELDEYILGLGYLYTAPGVLPGEELETITHVILRIQHNKSDGTQTPCIGMYYENPKLVYCKKAYLNTPEDIATFERLSGLKLAQLPKFPGQFPKRDDLSATEYILAAKTPFQIRMTDGTYTDDATGETKSTKVFAGFYDVSSKPATTQTTTASGNGNAGSQGAGESGKQNGIQVGQLTIAPDEITWKRWVFESTKFMYTDPDGKYVKERHSASLAKRMEDTGVFGINPKMTLYEVLSIVMRYRALVDMMIDNTDYQNIFGMSFDDYYEMHGAIPTWQRFNRHYMATNPSAKAKASGQ